MTEKKVKRGIIQLVPLEEGRPEENEVVMCKTVVNAAEIVPMMLVNEASRTVKVKKGEEVGRALPLRNMQRIRLDKKEKEDLKRIDGITDEEIMAPERFRAKVRDLLRANRDVVAKSDKDLAQTHSIQMRIDTGDHPPIKLRPYRTPIHKRPRKQ